MYKEFLFRDLCRETAPKVGFELKVPSGLIPAEEVTDAIEGKIARVEGVNPTEDSRDAPACQLALG